MSDDIARFMETYLKVEESQSRTVKLPHDEVVRLVVDDLITKYHFNVERGVIEWASAFEKVLRYYMTRDEVDAITGNK